MNKTVQSPLKLRQRRDQLLEALRVEAIKGLNPNLIFLFENFTKRCLQEHTSIEKIKEKCIQYQKISHQKGKKINNLNKKLKQLTENLQSKDKQIKRLKIDKSWRGLSDLKKQQSRYIIDQPTEYTKKQKSQDKQVQCQDNTIIDLQRKIDLVVLMYKSTKLQLTEKEKIITYLEQRLQKYTNPQYCQQYFQKQTEGEMIRINSKDSDGNDSESQVDDQSYRSKSCCDQIQDDQDEEDSFQSMKYQEQQQETYPNQEPSNELTEDKIIVTDQLKQIPKQPPDTSHSWSIWHLYQTMKDIMIKKC